MCYEYIFNTIEIISIVFQYIDINTFIHTFNRKETHIHEKRIRNPFRGSSNGS